MSGHITPRGPGRWAIVLELGRDPTTGKRRQKWIAFKGTKREAQQRLAELLHEMNAGTYVEPVKLTLGAFLERWLEDYARGAVRPTTFETYRILIQRQIVPALGHKILTDLRPLDLQRFYISKLQGGRADGKLGGLSPKTIRHLHRLLREALGHAVKWQLLARNVAEAVEPPRQVKHEMQVLDPGAVQAFLEAARQDRLYALYLLDLTTGLRRGELLALRWQDVDLDEGWLVIRQTVVVVRGRPVIQPEAKTRSGTRGVSLPATTVEALRAHRAQQDLERAAYEPDYQDNDLVFCQPDGRLLHPRNFTRRHFKPLLRRAGLPEDLRFHDLRHTHATMLLGAGVNIKLVSDRLGHADIRTTANTYFHVLRPMRDEVAATVEKIISGIEGEQKESKTSPESK